MELDWLVWKKTVKVFLQIIILVLISCAMVLLIASFCQQRVYQNTGLDRNAYMEMIDYVVGKK